MKSYTTCFFFPFNVPCLHVDDVGSVLPAVVELELVDADDGGCLLLLLKFAVYGVKLRCPAALKGMSASWSGCSANI